MVPYLAPKDKIFSIALGLFLVPYIALPLDVASNTVNYEGKRPFYP
jgi:hypothetical protein